MNKYYHFNTHFNILSNKYFHKMNEYFNTHMFYYHIYILNIFKKYFKNKKYEIFNETNIIK